ncbi:MAG: GntR family transcriptional regulator [Halanaerobiales bacterium]|nr:GntR family transcriptional regulator [Halanaerobiales bacterium]
MENILNEKKDSRSLTSIIFDKIRDDILIGKYKNGQKIVETKLAAELGVSRTPVREALKQLDLDGLVDNIPNRGVVVKGISHQDIDDIYTIRVVMEGIAVKWAVERMEEKEIEFLKEILDLMEFYTFKKDIEKVVELNTKFHEAIYSATKSRYIEHVLKDFQYFMKKTRYKSLSVPGRMEEALEEHRKILQAFINRDIDEAIKTITDHVNASKLNSEGK